MIIKASIYWACTGCTALHSFFALIKRPTVFLRLGDWQLSSPTTHLYPSDPHLDKLVRKRRCSVLRQEQASSGLCKGTPTTAPLPICQKTLSRVPLCALSSHFWACLETCPAFSRQPHYRSNKPFHASLVCVCGIHQSYHPNQI